jgi:NodT family efflux transporter outer membrane factor (OMF) lipoprotein
MNTNEKRRALLLGITAAALLASCAVGPDFKKPAPPDARSYSPEAMPDQTVSADVHGGEAQKFVAGLDIPGQWWTLYHSTALNELIEEALKKNPDLQSAAAALRAAEEGVYAQEGYYYPTLQANFTPSRYHNAVQPSPTLTTYVPYFNLYSAQVSAAWTPDIFGGHRRQVESLKATADATRDQLEAAYLTLTSSLVAAAIQEAGLRAQIDASERLVAINTTTLKILRQQFARGYASRLDVAAQEAQLAQIAATLPPLQKQLAQTRDLITALAGKLPSEKIAQTFELSELQLPTELPESLPAKAIEQRPDVRAAADNLHAATAQVGVAIANMLPNITISANDGTIATQLSQLFLPHNAYWTILGSATQTVFDGGTLLHKTRGARAALDQAEAQYRSTVISALQNVADSLHAVDSDAATLKATVDSDHAAKITFDIMVRQNRAGYTNVLALLNAEQTYRQAEISLVQAEATRYADTAALFQTLGGGWWNRDDKAQVASTKLQ